MAEFFSEIFSGVAVALSGYSLWQTTLKQSDLKVFVPPLIRYASPYQNSMFEVFEIPLTVINEGARAGTILSLDLEVRNVHMGASKSFYSAGLGPWSLAKVHGEGLQPFTPLALAGHTSHSATLLFYARNDSRVRQVVEDQGHYEFSLSLATAHQGGLPFLRPREPEPMTFSMILPFMDHRAFTSGAGTLPLHNPDWYSSSSG
jgi:hypothetical protein